MKLNNFWATLSIAFVLTKTMNQKDLNDFKLAILRKIYNVIPRFHFLLNNIELLFDDYSLKNEISNVDLNVRLQKILAEIHNVKLESIDEDILKELKE